MTILIGLLGIGLLVFVHELGHFISAKLCGITVEAFSIGWGPVLLKYNYKNTEYRLSALPLGGYCKMKGEASNQVTTDKEEQTEDGEFPPDSLFGVPAYKRLITYLAGPMANVLLAIVIFSTLDMIPSTEYFFDPIVFPQSELDGGSYPADDADIQIGDRILEINGEEIQSFSELSQKIALLDEPRAEILIDREGSIFSTTVFPVKSEDKTRYIFGIQVLFDLVVEQVSLANTGISSGDRIISINDLPVSNNLEYYLFMRKKPRRMDIVLQRPEGSQYNYVHIPEYTETGVTEIFEFKLQSYERAGNAFLPAFATGWNETWSTLGLIIRGIGTIFSGADPSAGLIGPIRLPSFLGEVALNSYNPTLSFGIMQFFRLLGFISISLFFMNLLPIPVLDGGMIVISFTEILIRKPIPIKVLTRLQIFGAIIVLSLIVFATSIDLIGIFSR
jgi:regulator of sigma E protease